MVMETPSPQCVGREFVRQYYTLLHEAPLHLHRFYSNNSSFVHGGVEKPGEEQPPVMGQAEIHKKIMSLNFRDCHAKIRQVDSQGTVGSAVVVQVTGELSNNGQPMRRFMQTFVLAPQSAKKYYVHNDIFRYQDEVFIDSDTDTENQEEIVDSEPEATDGGVISSEPVTDNNQQYFEQSPPMSNGTMHLEERTESPAQKSMGEEEEEVVDDFVQDEVGEEEEQVHEEPEEEYPEKEEEEEPEDTQKNEEIEQEEPQIADEPKPFSWAALASKNTQNASSHSSGSTNQGTQPVSKTSPQGFGNGRQEPLKTDSNPAAPQPQRTSRATRGHERDRQSVTRDSDIDSDGQGGRRGSRFPDSHQLFVGNLPHNITEKELKTFFEKYGSVMELRINTKSSGGKLPNFGFVVFDSPDPVQQILNMKPIKYNGEHRLNVEEKKPRVGEGRLGLGRGPPPRSGSAGGGGGGFSRGGGRGSGGGTRTGGPPAGVRGENRGGPNRGGMTGPRR
ncbi:hypothetical protein CHS0354_007240 [Potamilus streckersoni]|uniref:Ras GTPase-activating protein-binding protein 2 n=1 Tax=Potamilus streckersoni TaxID=2493646 RepID=A0AAE0TD63_9BIVA|nr:hypothetical protein CHS0354_007240 [Potamilus streckersoni]